MCEMHELDCRSIGRTETHEHRPMEPCVATCPYPHWDSEKAQDWWYRYCHAENAAQQQLINREALAPADNGRQRAYIN